MPFYSKVILHLYADKHDPPMPSDFRKQRLRPADHGAIETWQVAQPLGDQVWIFSAFNDINERDKYNNNVNNKLESYVRNEYSSGKIDSEVIVPDSDDIEWYCKSGTGTRLN